MTGSRERVEAALATATRRLFLRGLVEGAGWALLALLLALELALALAPHAPGLAVALLLAGGAGALVALVRAWRVRPGAAMAASVLDAGLGGAALATAQETLGGGHARFAGLVLDEAALRLERRALSALVPLRAPAGLLLAAAALALLPALLLAPGSAARAGEPGLAPPSLLSAAALSGGEPAGGAIESPVGPPAALALVAATPEAGGADPLAAFPAELKEVLRARLEELVRSLPPGAGGGAAGEAAARPETELGSAMAAGDAEAVLAALERLAADARGGDRPAAARLAELARAVGPPGGGGSSGDVEPSRGGSGPLPVVEPAGASGGRVQGLPRQLEAAVERYFRVGR